MLEPEKAADRLQTSVVEALGGFDRRIGLDSLLGSAVVTPLLAPPHPIRVYVFARITPEGEPWGREIAELVASQRRRRIAKELRRLFKYYHLEHIRCEKANPILRLRNGRSANRSGTHPGGERVSAALARTPTLTFKPARESGADQKPSPDHQIRWRIFSTAESSGLRNAFPDPRREGLIIVRQRRFHVDVRKLTKPVKRDARISGGDIVRVVRQLPRQNNSQIHREPGWITLAISNTSLVQLEVSELWKRGFRAKSLAFSRYTSNRRGSSPGVTLGR